MTFTGQSAIFAFISTHVTDTYGTTLIWNNSTIRNKTTNIFHLNDISCDLYVFS